ncbi:MAG: hypothetical protein ACJ8GN_19725 [Longimicrobiaceae bacterium]
MGYVVGAVLALVVCGLARAAGMDRDRAFYPTLAIVVASYYVLFAAMDGTTRALVVETAGALAFAALAVAGFRRQLWLAAAALAGHGLFDVVHDRLVENPGVPPWWPPFCIGFDLAAGGFLAWLLIRKK